MSLSSQNNGEVLHLALGDVAGAVSAHWLNLQGLAGTSNQSDCSGGDDHHYANHDSRAASSTLSAAAPSCNIAITHSVQNNVYVPRAVLVGNDTTPSTNSFPATVSSDSGGYYVDHQQPSSLQVPTWSGRIEQWTLTSPFSSSAQKEDAVALAPPQDEWSDARCQFRERAQSLAYATHSRYRACNNNDSKLSHSADNVTTMIDNNNSRHYNWDDENEEESDEDLDVVDEKERKRQDLMHWRKSQFRPTQDALDNFWNLGTEQTISSITSLLEADGTKPTSSSLPPLVHRNNLTWKDYLMPPYGPDTCVHPQRDSDLPSSGGGDMGGYYAAQTRDADWIETQVWERLRRRLEECDACQGLVMVEDGFDTSCGWGTAMLQTWLDECPHTCSWVVHLQQQLEQQSCEDDTEETTNTGAATDSNELAESSSLAMQRATMRRSVQQALVLADQTELASVYLPLQMSRHNSTTNDSSEAAAIGAALESVSLPYRLSGISSTRQQQQLAMQSYYSGSYSGSDSFGTAPTLSYREFIRTMERSSASRNVLELDAVLPWSNDTFRSSKQLDGRSLAKVLQQGTSLERDHCMKESGYDGGIHRARDALPGIWMNNSNPRGILKSWSPSISAMDDRSSHFHFALLTALRPVKYAEATISTSNYVTCLMESMGIGYRPVQSVCAVVDQSLFQVTEDGYGAGSYWSSILQSPLRSIPVLSVLGNTTRTYSHLHYVAALSKDIVTPRLCRGGSINRALFNRDVGVHYFPELDDCKEAVVACLDLRDTYEPPNGSGNVVNEENFDLDT